MRKVLGLEPQNGEVRQYVDALAPSVDRADEAYAWKPERFLEKRFEPQMTREEAARRRDRWRQAVERSRAWAQET